MSNYTNENLINISPNNIPAGTLAMKVGENVFTAGSITIGDTVTAGYAVNTDGVITFQDLNGSTPELVENIKIVNTGVDEPEYNGIKPMQIYKCASVNTASSTWSGYLYNIYTKTFSETLTEGLEYKNIIPKIDYNYNSDASITLYGVDKYAFWDKLTNAHRIPVTGQPFLEYGNPTFTTFQGRDCIHFEYMYSDIPKVVYDCSGIPADTTPRMYIFNIYSSGTTSGMKNFFTHGADDKIRFRSYFYEDNGSSLAFWVNSEVGTVYECRIQRGNTKLNQWVNIICYYTGSEMRIYQNGVLEHATQANLTGTKSDNETLVLGCHIDNTSAYDGYMQNFKILYGTYSDEEIEAEAIRCLAMVETSNN